MRKGRRRGSGRLKTARASAWRMGYLATSSREVLELNVAATRTKALSDRAAGVRSDDASGDPRRARPEEHAGRAALPPTAHSKQARVVHVSRPSEHIIVHATLFQLPL